MGGIRFEARLCDYELISWTALAAAKPGYERVEFAGALEAELLVRALVDALGRGALRRLVEDHEPASVGWGESGLVERASSLLWRGRIVAWRRRLLPMASETFEVPEPVEYEPVQNEIVEAAGALVLVEVEPPMSVDVELEIRPPPLLLPEPQVTPPEVWVGVIELESPVSIVPELEFDDPPGFVADQEVASASGIV